MHTVLRTSRFALVAATLMATFACGASASDMKVKLSGDQEVPPVKTMASGTAHFMIKEDMSIGGSVTTEGVKGTAAHIHEGAPGNNGGVVIPLTKNGDNEWTIPVGSKFTPAQMQALKAGSLYVNVHSDANKGGEIRGQLK